MRRGQFIKTSVLTAVGVALSQNLLFASTYQNQLSYSELIGKGEPRLWGDGFQIRKEAFTAFENMRKAAQKEGISLSAVSSYRNYAHQNRIWERKFKRYTAQGMDGLSAIKKIIKYSTIPGTSRHHWGTDMDLIDTSVAQPSSVLVPSHFEIGGCFEKMKLWMDKHSESYGFYLVYTKEPSRKGFKYEPWHYSFKPLSQAYLKAYRQLDFSEIILAEQLMGCEYFTPAFISQYLNENVLSINPQLL